MNIPLISVLLLSATLQSHVVFSAHQPSVFASIYDATFMDITPDFTDLYMIMTRDKAQPVTIYCNSRSCHRQRHVGMWV